MPDNPHKPIDLPLRVGMVGVPEGPIANPVDEEELARQELARISPSNAKLLALAAKNPPLPKWFDEEEDAPF